MSDIPMEFHRSHDILSYCPGIQRSSASASFLSWLDPLTWTQLIFLGVEEINTKWMNKLSICNQILLIHKSYILLKHFIEVSLTFYSCCLQVLLEGEKALIMQCPLLRSVQSERGEKDTKTQWCSKWWGL